MNIAALNQIAALLEQHGATPTKDMVISLAIRTLTEAGYSVRDAFELVMGQGSFETLASAVYEQLRTRTA